MAGRRFTMKTDGSTLAAERDEALAGGMNAVLLKPVEPLVLARTVAAHVTRRPDVVPASS